MWCASGTVSAEGLGYHRAMPKLACWSCGRQIYTVAPLESLFARGAALSALWRVPERGAARPRPAVVHPSPEPERRSGATGRRRRAPGGAAAHRPAAEGTRLLGSAGHGPVPAQLWAILPSSGRGGSTSR